MTKVALLSDVHADVHALQDALRQIERLGCQRILCAGDLVDYGLFADETLRLLEEHEIPCIRGNHDRWAIRDGGSNAGISKESIRFLRSLPTEMDAVIDGVRVAIRHGTPKSDMEGIGPEWTTGSDLVRFLDEAGADVLVVGHTHLRFRLCAPGGRAVVNPGALLRHPADDHVGGPPAPGTFGVLELPSKRFTVYRAGDGKEAPFVDR